MTPLCAAYLLFVPLPVCSGSAGPLAHGLRRALDLYRAVLAHPAVNMPLGGTIAGIACAAVGPVRSLLVVELAPLHWLWLSLVWVGAAAAPLATMQIGELEWQLPQHQMTQSAVCCSHLMRSRLSLQPVPGGCCGCCGCCASLNKSATHTTFTDRHSSLGGLRILNIVH